MWISGMSKNVGFSFTGILLLVINACLSHHFIIKELHVTLLSIEFCPSTVDCWTSGLINQCHRSVIQQRLIGNFLYWSSSQCRNMTKDIMKSFYTLRSQVSAPYWL